MEVTATRVRRRTRVAIAANVAVIVLVSGGILYGVNRLAGQSALRRAVDLTQHSRNTLSPKTESVLRGVKEPVECSTFFRVDDFLMAEVQGKVVDQTLSTLRLYERVNPESFKLTVYDLTERMAEAKAKAAELKISEANVVVLRAGSRQKEVRLDDLAVIDRGDMNPFGGGGRPPRLVAFKAEEALTNAIVSITQGEERKVYFVKGHGEAGPYDTQDEGASRWVDLLRKDGLRVEELALPEKRAIPEDASAVIVLGPQRPFLPDETAALRAYAGRGGRLLVAIDPTPRPDELGEPTGVLADWGLKLGRGIVCMPLLDVLTGSLIHGTEQCAQVVARPLSSHEITRPLAEAEFAVRLPYTRAIERLEPGADGVAASDLVETTTGDKAWDDLPGERGWDFRFDPGTESEAVRTLAVAAERDAGEGTASAPASAPAETETKARLVVVGSAAAAMNLAIERYGKDLFMNSVNWLLERSSLIAIAPKPPEERRIDLREEGTRSTLFWVCIPGLPFLTALSGVLVWWRRRR